MLSPANSVDTRPSPSEPAPGPIRSEEEDEACAETLRELDRRSGRATRAEKELAELLTVPIEDFEEKRYRQPHASPLATLRFLMDQHGLEQKDLVDVFQTPGIVSEVLAGKRQLSKGHIARLSKRFHVSPELFF